MPWGRRATRRDDRATDAANLPTLGSATDPVAASASAPSRLPGGLEGDALVQGAAGVESGSDPVAASASAPSRLPGGLEGDALVQGAAGVESGSDPVAASASAPSRLPGGLEGDALATVPLLRRICQHSQRHRPGCRVGVCAFSAAWRFEGDALGRRPWASRVGPTRLPRRRLRLLVCLAVLRATPWCRGRGVETGWLPMRQTTVPLLRQICHTRSATDPVAVSASAPSRLPGGFEGDAVGQAAVGVESGSDPVAASASAPSRLPGGLEGDALVQGAAGVETGWLPMRLQRERGTLPLQEGCA
eukprot:tig00020996_g16960.t1